MADSGITMAIGTHLFVQSQSEVWQEAVVDNISGSEIIVKLEGSDKGKKVVLKKGELFYPRSNDHCNTSSGYPDDLTDLTHLHEASVLHSLDCRFKTDDIYTFTGKILIAVNPFKAIPGLYTDETIIRFMDVSQERVPHVFTVAKDAYNGMTLDEKSQTILISGESGAGKTESTKFALKFLATAGAESLTRRSPVELRVLDSNPLLETFGNASTVRNANSSRFGKFIELQYRKDNPTKSRLCGAKIETYLLEKVRICQQQKGERNYHIFHELIAAYKRMPNYKFPQKDCYKHLAPWEFDLNLLAGDFRIIPPHSETSWDLDFFEETVAAMQTVGMSKDDVDVVFKIVQAVMHLCNIEFVVNKDCTDGAVVNNTLGNPSGVVSDLLGVDSGALLNALLCRTIKTANEMYTKPLRVDEACDVRDAVAKNIYSMLFDHIVDRANTAIGYVSDAPLTCGVLDIFGFECFQENSFEQLCINFTNETLQNFFNNFVFKCEEDLYSREGIPWDPLDFPDNSDCIELFKSKPNGLFVMIDEECQLPGGRDQSLVDKIVRRHTGNKRFDKVKTDKTCFVINHFAGSVKYGINGFLEKNKDQLSADAVNFILSTKNEHMKFIFESYLERKMSSEKVSPRRRQKTISTQFTGQLDSLMKKISETEPHFIRCIKPNQKAVPLLFERTIVNGQLRCGGMLQVVQVSRAGFPVRLTHNEVISTFRYLLEPEHVKSALAISDLRARSEFVIKLLSVKYMKHLVIDQSLIAVGETLVFMKNAPYEAVYNSLLEFRNKNATIIQAMYRAKLQRRWFIRSMRLVKSLQIWLRFKIKIIKRKRARRLAAIVMIQTMFRMYRQRSILNKLVACVVRLQAIWRTKASQEATKQRRINNMATKIQAAWKGYARRTYYLRLLDATIKAQLRWRGILARRQLRSLRMEAKSLATMIKKTQELQDELTEERNLRQDAEARLLQLTAKVNSLQQLLHEMQEQIDSLTAERNTLVERLAEAGASSKKSQEDLRKLKDFLSREAIKSTGPSWVKDVSSIRAEAKLAAATPIKSPGTSPDLRPVDVPVSNSPLLMPVSPVHESADAHIRKIKQLEHETRGFSDIIICGPSKCGKSRLIELALMRVGDEKNLELLRSFDGGHRKRLRADVYDFTLDLGRALSLTEIPGQFLDSDEARIIYRNTHLIAVVFDPSNAESFEESLEFIKILTLSISTRGTSFCLVQNDYITIESGKQSVIDYNIAQQFAVENEILYLRVTDLMEFMRNVAPFVDSKKNLKLSVASGKHSFEFSKHKRIDSITTVPLPQSGRSALTVFYEKFRSFWAGINYSGETNKLLQPTMIVPADTRMPPLNLKRVAQISNYASAVTCVAFKPEEVADPYVLLAVGRRDGSINLYHCFRTATEVKVLSGSPFDEADQKEVDDRVTMAESFTLSLHTKAVTCMSFSRVNPNELVTSSVDCTIRAWNVSNGQLIKVFNDSFPGLAVLFHPVETNLFISCNSNPTIRLIDYNKGSVLQKIRTKSELRCLVFDDTKLNCIAGSERGTVAVYESQTDMHLKLTTTKQISRGPVTCLNFVPATTPDTTPCIIANVCSGNITVLNCFYDGTNGRICEISYRYTVNNNHVALPLRSCISKFGGGWCISGSEDRNLLIFNLLEENMPYSISFHQGPVVAVAANQLDTILATSDSKGVVALWRRVVPITITN